MVCDLKNFYPYMHVHVHVQSGMFLFLIGILTLGLGAIEIYSVVLFEERVDAGHPCKVFNPKMKRRHFMCQEVASKGVAAVRYKALC